jgi:hypothetical protein
MIRHGERPDSGLFSAAMIQLRMHRRLTRAIKRWAAAVLVAAYGFGVLAPAVAFAQADRDAVTHVLSESHGGALTLHFHGDEERHEHSGTSGSKLAHHCCGLISLVGLEPLCEFAVLQPTMKRLRFALAPQSCADLFASPPDRPPRSSLPL